MLGRSFHNLVVAGMKHLEYGVLSLIGEKDILLTHTHKKKGKEKTSSDSPGIKQVGKLRTERMQRIVKNHVKHTRQTNGTVVLQTNSKIRN